MLTKYGYQTITQTVGQTRRNLKTKKKQHFFEKFWFRPKDVYFGFPCCFF